MKKYSNSNIVTIFACASELAHWFIDVPIQFFQPSTCTIIAYHSRYLYGHMHSHDIGLCETPHTQQHTEDYNTVAFLLPSGSSDLVHMTGRWSWSLWSREHYNEMNFWWSHTTEQTDQLFCLNFTRIPLNL